MPRSETVRNISNLLDSAGAHHENVCRLEAWIPRSAAGVTSKQYGLAACFLSGWRYAWHVGELTCGRITLITPRKMSDLDLQLLRL